MYTLKKEREVDCMEQNGLGRPTKYEVKMNNQVEKLCKLGATDKEIADFFGICEATLNVWKKTEPDFMESIKRGKVIADMDVANSLHKRALGYTYIEAREEISPDGSVKTSKTLKEVSPDTGAAMAWLKNRRPKEWRDKQDIELSGEIKMPSIIIGK